MSDTLIEFSSWQDFQELGALIIAVPHTKFNELSVESLGNTLISGGCIIDVKSMFEPGMFNENNIGYWRL